MKNLKHTFRDVETGDTLFMFRRAQTVQMNDNAFPSYSIYCIEEVKVVDVEHRTTCERNFGDRYDPDYRTVPCNKYDITFLTNDSQKKVINVDLTDSDTYQYTFADVFVNREDAEEHLREYYKWQYENHMKAYKWHGEALEVLRDAMKGWSIQVD